ncbi:MAG TPA: hypothetical protein VJ023_05125 [Pyrinomonadaceae bacterium]|nr:hypothetical protein [Pyrinomonadaceae bacterium]
MKRNEHNPECNIAPPSSGTRDAVESAIDKAKGDKTSSWETLTKIAKAKGITHWREIFETDEPQPDQVKHT